MKRKTLSLRADGNGLADPRDLDTNDIRSRGCFEDLDAFPGTISFSLRDRKGTRIFHCTMPSHISTEARDSLLLFIESWLDELDPTPDLGIVR